MRHQTLSSTNRRLLKQLHAATDEVDIHPFMLEYLMAYDKP